MENNINIQLYSSCNCNCSFCHFRDKLFTKINPSFVLDYLKEHDNINYIVLTGGEPTFAIEEYKDIVNNIDKTKKVILQTNGWWGNNDYIKEIIKESPPTMVHLSVDKEKQNMIPIDTVVASYHFLEQNNIPLQLINHTNDECEYLNYKQIFPNVKRGKVLYNDNIHSHDCGLALLANNTIGKLDIKGWRC